MLLLRHLYIDVKSQRHRSSVSLKNPTLYSLVLPKLKTLDKADLNIISFVFLTERCNQKRPAEKDGPTLGQGHTRQIEVRHHRLILQVKA